VNGYKDKRSSGNDPGAGIKTAQYIMAYVKAIRNHGSHTSISKLFPVFRCFNKGGPAHCQQVKQTARHCERSEAIQMPAWIASALRASQ
jgi:hypothetical protein